MLNPLAYAVPHDEGLYQTEVTEESDPTIYYDMIHLPYAVFETRRHIIEAAKTGDIERLRPLLAPDGVPTKVYLNEPEGDPITFLKNISGDGEGVEILSILINLLQSGYVIMDKEGENELYVWPYFVALPLEKLSKAQMVEAYQIMTAGDFDVMREIGHYTFFRLGISPDGHWHFFLTGD